MSLISGIKQKCTINILMEERNEKLPQSINYNPYIKELDLSCNNVVSSMIVGQIKVLRLLISFLRFKRIFPY